jgi:hypothetical protein
MKVMVKLKFTLEQATKAQRGSRGIALLFVEWVVSATPRALYYQERHGTHCIGGGVGPRSGVGGCEKTLPPPDSIPGRPARSESLYRLSYPGPLFLMNMFEIP